MRVYLFANEPGLYFLETDGVSLDEIDKEAYCAKEVEDFDPEVMEMLVEAGIQGYFSAPSDCTRADIEYNPINSALWAMGYRW